MLHGRVARPPVIGATVGAVEDTAARALPGVVTVLHEDDFVGVVADNACRRRRGSERASITWHQPERLVQQAESRRCSTRHGGTELQATPATSRGRFARPAPILTAEYRTGFASQAPIEPQVGVADVRADSATVYAPTQASVRPARRCRRDLLGLKAEQVDGCPDLARGRLRSQKRFRCGASKPPG